MGFYGDGGSRDVLPGAVQQFHHHLVFIKLDDVDGGEMLADAKQVGNGKPEQVSQDGPVDPSVAHEGDGVVGVAGGDFQKFRDNPVVQFLKGFSAIGAEQFGLLEAFVHLAGELFTEFRQAFAFPFSEGQFAKFRKGHGFQSVMPGDQVGSLISPLEIAGIDGADGVALQGLGQLIRLFEAGVRQGDVEMAVHADLVGIGGFAVAKQIDAAPGCSLEGAGPGIRRCGGGRHETLVKDIKKDGKPRTWTCHLLEYGMKRSTPIINHRCRWSTGRRNSAPEPP